MAKNTNRGNRDATPKETLTANVKAAGRWANTGTGRSVLAGLAATAAGLLLSRDRRVRDAATSAGRTVRETATEAAGKVRAKVNERRGREVGDDLAEQFEVPVIARTDNSVIAH